MTDLRERVADMRAWAESRIRLCQREELKFGSGRISLEAATERRALQAVLRQLGFEDRTAAGAADGVKP